MSDGFNLDDALTGQSSASGQQTHSQGQNYNPWGGPGQPYPGGYPAPGQGQPYPGGYPQAGPQGGQQYPGGFPQGGPQGGQQYPGGFPQGGPQGGQQYPGGFPGYPGFPGQQFPGQPTDPKTAGQSGPTPSAPAPTGPLKMPYVLPLSAGIMPGLVVTIQGVLNPNAQRFSVDFKAGNDIAFHFNPRFNEEPNVLVRNTMTKGCWGAEERAAPKFPFQRGQPFVAMLF